MPKKALFQSAELESLTGYLHRFALLKLRDDDLARDAVQDALVAALENRASFAGKSTLKTWLTAILKFKIIDLIRPEAAFEEKEFWRVFEGGLALMPGKTQRVFVMRDVLGHNTEEICKELKITETNCWVILHRARMGMRQYLNDNWFQTAAADSARLTGGLLGDFATAIPSAGSQSYARGSRSTETALRAL